MPGRKRARTDAEVENAQHGAQHDESTTDNPAKGKRRSNIKAQTESSASRSNTDVIEGGANEYLGEPAEGYGTEAPGLQQGGKR